MNQKRTRIFVRVSRLNRKWTNEILILLFFSKKLNFNGIKKSLKGMTSKILANRLKKLEKYCIIKKVEAPEKMIRWYYKLTKKGKNFVMGLIDVINYSMESERENKKE